METSSNVGDIQEIHVIMDDFMLAEEIIKKDCYAGTLYYEDDHSSKKRKRIRIDYSENDSEQTNTEIDPLDIPQSSTSVPFTNTDDQKIPTTILLALKEPEDFYKVLVSDELFDKIATETNFYAAEQLVKGDKKPFSRSHSWKPTDVQEMKQFFGLILFMGLVRLPNIYSYWTKDEILGQKFPTSVMSRNRFELILQYLNFFNEDNDDPADCVDSIRELTNQVNDNFKKYTPIDTLENDGSSNVFRGQLIMHQYNRLKKNKSGMKLFKVSTLYGYTYRMQIYYGKNIEDTYNSPTNIALSFCEELLKQDLNCGIGSWYTDLQLAYKLLKSNREELEISDDDGVIITKWQEKKVFLSLSTKPPSCQQQKTTTKKGEKLVTNYDKTKAAVEMAEQMSWSLLPSRKNVKWCTNLVIDLILNTAVMNAWILYKETTNKNISMSEFRKLLVKYLTWSADKDKNDNEEEFICGDIIQESDKHVLKQKTGMVRKSRRFCTQCYKASVKEFGSKIAKNKCLKVSTYCEECAGQPHYCLKCFNKFHKSSNSKV